MSVGTPGFVGERLREAREARGISMSELASSVEVSRAAISLLEKGQTTPQTKLFKALSNTLNVPEPFFLKKNESEHSVGDTLFYRSLRDVPKTYRVKAERKYEWLKVITAYLRGFVRFPSPNLPSIDLPRELTSIEQDVVERAATLTRRHWGLGDGPISNVMLLLENNGVFVSKSTFDTQKMDGYSAIDRYSETPYVIIAYDKGSAVRSRFDLAHELGHHVLHQHLASQVVRNPTNLSIIEKQAHGFAAAFLLPERAFAADIQMITLDALQALKRRWGVSISAMLHRTRDLEWVSAQDNKRLWVNLSKRGWRTNEPLDDLLETERPRLLRKAIELLIESHVKEPREIASEICLSRADICELAGLEPSTLTDSAVQPITTVTNEKVADVWGLEQYRIERPIQEARN